MRDITERFAREEQLAVAKERSAVLEDRERIAQELHDSLINQLMAVGLTLDAIGPLVEVPTVRDRSPARRAGTGSERR